MLPRWAITIAPPCSAALPTIATITTAMKNSLRPTALPNASSEWTRISETNAVATVATASSSERRSAATTRCASGAARSASRWMRRLCTVIDEVDARAARPRPGSSAGTSECGSASRRASRESDGIRSSSDGAEHRDELQAQRARGRPSPVAAGDHRRAEHEQDVRDDRAGDRAADDVRQAVGDREAAR